MQEEKQEKKLQENRKATEAPLLLQVGEYQLQIGFAKEAEHSFEVCMAEFLKRKTRGIL